MDFSSTFYCKMYSMSLRLIEKAFLLAKPNANIGHIFVVPLTSA